MAFKTGFQEVTSGVRASETFAFQGGGIGYMVVGATSTGTPDWDLEILLPDGTTWQRVHANSGQIDSAKPYGTLTVPSGTYRLHCDTTTVAHYEDVQLFWAYVPRTMQDATLF